MFNQRKLECLNWTNYLLHLLNYSHKLSYGGEHGEYILIIEKKFCAYSLTRYQTRSSKNYAEQSEAGIFLRDNGADKLK